MLALLAHFTVRYPLLILALWGVVAIIAIPKASHINDVLQVEAVSTRLSEAKQAQKLVEEKFSAPVSEFFAVAIVGPVPIENPQYAGLVERLGDVALAEPYINRVVSFFDTSDSALVSVDGTGVVLWGQSPNSEQAYWDSIVNDIGSRTIIDPYGKIDGGQG